MARTRFWKVKKEKRQWLNKEKHTSAFIIWSIDGQEYEKNVNLDANLRIADCSRIIDLEFWAFDHDDDLKNRRAKVQTLREMIVSFCDEYEKQLDNYEEAKKRVDARKG